MVIKVILFDFWGTLVENGAFPSPVRQVKKILNLEMEFSEYIQIFEKEFMLKEWTDLFEGFTHVCQVFKITPTKQILDDLVGLWNKNKLFAKPYIETKVVLDSLKENYKLVLISNTDCFSVEQVMEKYDLNKIFDEIFLSYKEKKLKTDPDFFDMVIEKLGITKDQAIIVGDSLESDITPAKNAGIKAVLVDRRSKRDYPDKIRNLRELKKFLG